jgi:large subunit ribosomal protein L17
MRHRKHNHQLGVKSAHRVSLVANLSCSLIEHGRIKTTLAKARALRPAVEKIITLAKKAHQSDDNARKIHYRRLAIAKIRNKKAVAKLFDELVEQFIGRSGGYTRIYKLAIPRLGDAADMALIEFVEEAPKKKAKKKKAAPKKSSKKESAPQEVFTDEDSSENSSEISASLESPSNDGDSSELTNESGDVSPANSEEDNTLAENEHETSDKDEEKK